MKSNFAQQMAKRKRKTMKELAKGVRQFLKNKEVNENNGELFEKAVKKSLKPDSK